MLFDVAFRRWQLTSSSHSSTSLSIGKLLGNIALPIRRVGFQQISCRLAQQLRRHSSRTLAAAFPQPVRGWLRGPQANEVAALTNGRAKTPLDFCLRSSRGKPRGLVLGNRWPAGPESSGNEPAMNIRFCRTPREPPCEPTAVACPTPTCPADVQRTPSGWLAATEHVRRTSRPRII